MRRIVSILILILAQVGAWATTLGTPGLYNGSDTTNLLSIGGVQPLRTGASGTPSLYNGSDTTNYVNIGGVQKDVPSGGVTAGTLTITAHTVDSVSTSWTSATGGTAPITEQLQITANPVGTWSNVSGATASPGYALSLTANTTYNFRVAYTDAAATTVYSNTNSATTDAAAVIAFTSPKAYQTIPRQGLGGLITITGTYTGSPTTIEAKWGNYGWETIVASPPYAGPGTNFTATLARKHQGQGTLQVRFSNDTSVNTSTVYVGIGPVFDCAGQSNMSGPGLNNQSYAHPLFKATEFANDYLWKELTDPYDSNSGQIDSVSSDGASGSFIPLLATQLMANFNAPVAFIPCAKSSTAISSWQPGSNHQDRTTLYGSSVYRGLQAGVSAVLWWQGESDAVNSVSAASYNTSFETVVNGYWSDLGVKTYAMLLQNCTDATITDDPSALANIRTGTQTAFTDLPTKCGLLADLHDLNTDDGLHERSDANLLTVATRAAAGLNQALFHARKASMF